MPYFYKNIVIVVGILLPYFVFAYRNRFNNATLTLSRAVGAVIIGWAYMLVSTLLITDIDLKLAKTEQEIQLVSSGDGAKHAAALLVGWFPPLLLVIVYWVVHKIIAAVRPSNG